MKKMSDDLLDRILNEHRWGEVPEHRIPALVAEIRRQRGDERARMERIRERLTMIRRRSTRPRAIALGVAIEVVEEEYQR